MINFENLRGQWEKTLRVVRGYTLVDTFPLECYIGYDEKLRRTLLILCKHETKIPPSSQSVEINQRQRRDLMNSAEEATDEAQALKKFWQRYAGKNSSPPQKMICSRTKNSAV